MAKSKTAATKQATRGHSYLRTLLKTRRLLQQALAAQTREENRHAKATARAYAIVQLDKEVVLVGVSAEVPYRIGGLWLRLEKASGKIKVSLRVGNRRWVHRLDVKGDGKDHAYQVYAEDAQGRRTFGAWVYPHVDRASAEAHLPKVARNWKMPSRVA